MILQYMLLKISGMIDLFDLSIYSSNTDDIEMIISIDADNDVRQSVINTNIPKCNLCIYKYIINIIYKLYVACLLCWPLIYAIYLAIIYKQFKYFSANIIISIPIFQFIFGNIYYKSNHFSQLSKRYAEYHKYILLFNIIIIIISLGIPLIMLAFLLKQYKLSIFNELFKNHYIVNKIFIAIFIFLNEFYDFLVISCNVATFSIVFVFHSVEINKYSKKLENFIDNNESGLTLEAVTKEHAEKKNFYNISVAHLNNIFSSFTVCGILGTYFVVLYYKSIYVGIYQYIYVGVFIIIELVYIFSINKVKTCVSNIISLMSSEKVISRYLSSTELVYMSSEIDFNNVEQSDIVNNIELDDNKAISLINKKINHLTEINLRSLIRVNENSKSISWHTLQRKLCESWDNFKVCGFDIDDATIISQTVTVISGFLMLLNIKTSIGL